MVSHATTPLFTVIIPCYRAAATIRVAIESVLAQDDGDFELIIIDDGSPDDSVVAACKATGGDRRCMVIPLRNGGPAAARNAGAALARGRLLAFLDADDRWMPGLLSAHRELFARHGEVGVSFARTRFFDADLTKPGRCSAHVAEVDLGRMLAENPLCTTSNMVVRRDLFQRLGGFDTTLTHAEDQEFVVRVLATTDMTVTGIDAPLVHYRTSPHGLSSDLAAMEDGWQALLERARSYTDPKVFAEAEPAARALHARYLARRALRTGQSGRRALAHFRTALRADLPALLGSETRRTLLTAAGIAAAITLPRRLISPIIAA